MHDHSHASGRAGDRDRPLLVNGEREVPVLVPDPARVDVLLADRREVVELVARAVPAGEVLERLNDDVGVGVAEGRPVVEVRVRRLREVAVVLAGVEVHAAEVEGRSPAAETSRRADDADRRRAREQGPPRTFHTRDGVGAHLTTPRPAGGPSHGRPARSRTLLPSPVDPHV